MTPRVWLPVALALLAAGCATRDPSNPLDPENPDTGGDPAWVRAVADRGAVDLEWAVPYFDDVASVRVVDATSEAVLWTGGFGRHTLRQSPVPDGVTRSYRVDLELLDGRVLAVPQGDARPGPEVPWLLDGTSGRVRRLAPDGRQVRFSLPGLDRTRIAADGSGRVILADFFRGRVSVYDPAGSLVWENDSTFFRPLAVLAGDDGSWWVGDTAQGRVVHLAGDGGEIGRVEDLGRVVDLARGAAGRVWVADQDGRVLSVHTDQGVVAVHGDLQSPEALAPAPEGGVWVSDLAAARLLRLDADAGLAADSGGRAGIVSLTADLVEPGGVWAADRGRRRVVLVDAGGNDVAEIAGFAAPSSVAISPDGAELWVADPALRQLVRLTRGGEVLLRNLAVGDPLIVAVAHPPAP